MASYFIALQVNKGRIEYADKESRDSDFLKILNFFRSRGFTASDVVLKRVDSIAFQEVEHPEQVMNYDKVVEIQ